jgi:hypothetical protein
MTSIRPAVLILCVFAASPRGAVAQPYFHYGPPGYPPMPAVQPAAATAPPFANAFTEPPPPPAEPAVPVDPVPECPPWRVWARFEGLAWHVSGAPLPILLATGDPFDPVAPGGLGRPGTVPLYGGGDVQYPTMIGARATIGGWFDCDAHIGMDASFFMFGRQSTGVIAGSDALGNPPLYIPIFRPEVGREGSFAISDPFGQGLGPVAGQIAIENSLRFWGWDMHAIIDLDRTARWDVAILFGVRYLDLTEQLDFRGTLDDNVFDIHSRYREAFGTRNQFYGSQIGTLLGWRRNCFTVDFLGKIAIGATHEVVNIGGTSTFSGTGTPNGTFAGAILTQPSNLGRQSTDNLAVVPEMQLKAGVSLGRCVNLFVGYEVLYWSDVVRAADQVDHAVNVPAVAGTPQGSAEPRPLFRTSDFWAQGVTFGVELKY